MGVDLGDRLGVSVVGIRNGDSGFKRGPFGGGNGLRMIAREGVEMVGAEGRELLGKQTLDWSNQLSQPQAEMSSTLLEVTRAAHEDVEQLERLMVKDLQNDPPTAKDKLYQSHRVRNNIDTIISTTEKLIEIYEDKDNARKDEIAALGGQTATGINVFSAFYDRLKEEAFGRYLDLHELFNQYINSKFGSKIEYSAYLDVFSQPHNIPWKLKSTRQFREYMENLLEYLIYFFQRTEPLQDLDRIFSKVEAEFEEQWANGRVQGWEKQGQENEDDPAQHTMIDLDYYSTVEELMEVGPEKLKEHTPLEKLDKKHFAKGSHGPRQNGSTAVSQDINSLKHIALMEAKMKKLSDLLSKTIEQTKENVVKKQALTYEEMEQEREEITNPGPKHLVWMAVGRVLNAGACMDQSTRCQPCSRSAGLTFGLNWAEETQVDTESDDEDQQIYNPLKLPMGWDGKPIPYWLYKLHGLGQREEEVGVLVRHLSLSVRFVGTTATGAVGLLRGISKNGGISMACDALVFHNTKNFNEITNIQEAQELWEKIRERQGVNKWRPDLEEEYEDKEGNIYNKKTYTDLQRQGLI
ncbi:hypothetical protein GOBAR_DD10446 [Gossypium barbadense]|nr:hypothetical protein GOBAR_DD10446 [Gossypium barbadense]